MKLLPAATISACAALLVSCGPKSADTSTIEKQQQIIEQQQAREERELHERQAALDEQQRLLNEREQKLAVATPAPEPPAQPTVAQQPATPPPQEAPASTADVSYQQFYDSLAPYGSWIQMTGYGYAWQPQATIQDPRWRPYTLGHWAYTDDGWTWVSDESFGWITYHYGRWMLTHTQGWVWLPGDQWAPAWVSWRYGSDFVGWAPLPPEARFNGATGIKQWADQQYNLGASDYVFVPASDFGGDEMASIEVPPDQNGPIYDESNNITNIYDTGGVIYCFGPDYVFLSGKARGHFPPKLKLTRMAFSANGSNGVAVAGTLRVTAPRIVAGRRAETPKSVREIGIADARLVNPPRITPPHGSVIPPLYRPTQPAREPAAPAATHTQPPPAPPAAQVQGGRDVQIIQQHQASGQQHQQQQMDQQRAADMAAVRNQRAIQDQQAAREQAAHVQAAHDQSAQQEAAKVEAARQDALRQAQPSGSPGFH